MLVEQLNGNHAAPTSNIRRIVIDTDCGVDDACAILLAVRTTQKQSDVRIEAITTVCGNVALSKVRPNVLRVLELCGATEIPVFEGASSPVLQPFRDATYCHGEDGFGGVSHKYRPADVPVPNEHAVHALVRLARTFKNELSLICLGPLTNIALAQKLEPNFLENLKEIVVMGGSCSGSGNDTPGAEFNFGCDPEAMAIVINENSDPEKLRIVTYDACRYSPLSWTWYDSLDDQSTFINFLKDVLSNLCSRLKTMESPGLYVYDMAAVALFLDPLISAKSITCPVYPELAGRWSRGAIVLDRRNSKAWEKEANAQVVCLIDAHRLKRMFDQIL